MRSTSQQGEFRKLLTNGQCPLYLLAEAISRCIYIKVYYQANNRGEYADWFYNSMIDDKDGHISSPLIMFTCTALHDASLECLKNKGVHPKASNSILKADGPDRLNYFNYKNDDGKNASCCAATGCKLLTSPGVADAYAFLMNSWNTLLESYQQRVHNNTLATVNCQMQQAENPMPAVVTSVEAARVNNAILLHYLTSEVALDEPEIRSTDPNIPIDNNCTDDNLISGCQGAAEIANMKVMIVTCMMPSPRPAGDNGPWLTSRDFTWEPVMLTCMSASMATMGMRMRSKKHRKPMMDQRRLLRTQGIVGLTREPVMSTGMSVSTAKMPM